MGQTADGEGTAGKVIKEILPGIYRGIVGRVKGDDLSGVFVDNAVAVCLQGRDLRFTAGEHDQLHRLGVLRVGVASEILPVIKKTGVVRDNTEVQFSLIPDLTDKINGEIRFFCLEFLCLVFFAGVVVKVADIVVKPLSGGGGAHCPAGNLTTVFCAAQPG